MPRLAASCRVLLCHAHTTPIHMPLRSSVRSFQVRWLAQVPRLYAIYKKIGFVQNFAELLANFFTPLFEVTD
jgi:hypothetical protein